jgi:hypothetical protein
VAFVFDHQLLRQEFVDGIGNDIFAGFAAEKLPGPNRETTRTERVRPTRSVPVVAT